jgi:hypothetical protein
MALLIFICLTCSTEKVYKETNVHRLDGPVRRNREPACNGVPKHDMTSPVLIVIDAHAAGDSLQIVNPLVSWIPLHLGDNFRRIRHNLMVSRAVPHAKLDGGIGSGTCGLGLTITS